MLLRLVLSVLLAALGCPAAATQCHDAPAMRMTAAMHPAAPAPTQRQHDAGAPHACVGCIPPESLRAKTPAAPVLASALPASRPPAALDRDHGILPALPPPRA